MAGGVDALMGQRQDCEALYLTIPSWSLLTCTLYRSFLLHLTFWFKSPDILKISK